eukprot:gene6699-6922_t
MPPKKKDAHQVVQEDLSSEVLLMVSVSDLELTMVRMLQLINASLDIRLYNSLTNALLAFATVDLLPFGLGNNAIENPLLPLQPVTSEDVLKVLPGSTVNVTVKLMHQPARSTPTADTATATSSSSTTSLSSQAAASSGSGAPAAPLSVAAVSLTGSTLEPLQLLSRDEAHSCNVLELVPQSVQPLPMQLPAVVANINGAMSFSLGLHLPGSQDALELSQPLLLEVARYAGAVTPTELLSDPAFGSYHALLQLDCAAEQLQEPGSIEAAGAAVAVGCMSWAIQQGRVASAGLPPYISPTGRTKAVEEGPPAAAADASQPPVCPWLAAGSRFAVKLKLARSLYPPWQPPQRPDKQLIDIISRWQPPAPPPPPTAALRFRQKVQAVAEDLANSFAATSSSGFNAADQQQALVFELNCSRKYLSMKEQLKQLVTEVVQEKYATAGTKLSAEQVQQVHNDLYVYLTDELHKALTAAGKGLENLQQPHKVQSQQPMLSSQHDSSRSKNSCSSNAGSCSAGKLLQLANECEASGDFQRGHKLHQRRIVLLESAEAWYQYGVFCMHIKCHLRAEAALKEALGRDQQHVAAAAALVCLGLAQLQGRDATPEGPGEVADVQERTEVLACTLKDAASGGADGAIAVSWALMAVFYRMQGNSKTQARSCHQEVVRLSKSVTAAPATPLGQANAGGPLAEGGAETNAGGVNYADHPAANGYLAGAELAVRLRLPALAEHMLELAGGLRDPTSQLLRRSKLAAVAIGQQLGNTQQVLQLVKELSDQAAQPGREGNRTLVQAGNTAQAKQHYRRAWQRVTGAMSAGFYMRLGNCFMATADASAAADTYTACLESAAATPEELGCRPLAPFVATAEAAEIGHHSAPIWLALGTAYIKTADYRSAELALAEANLQDPEHPAVWAQLAMLALLTGKHSDAAQALKQAQRYGVAEHPGLLVELADRYQELQLFGTAGTLLAKAAAVQDSMQRDYQGCQQQLTIAAARSAASEVDKKQLEAIVQKLQVAWPEL